MEIKILSQENGMAKVGLTLPGSELTKAIDKARKEDQDRQDPALLREAVQNLFSGVYQDVMKQIDLPVASEPKVAVLSVSEDEGVEFTLSFALRPKMKLGRYKGIHVKMPSLEPAPEEFDQALQAAEAQNVTTITVDRPAKLGDTTVIDFKGIKDGVAFQGGTGSDYPLVLGSGQFIPGFEDQLVGASAGGQVQVRVTFPENYHAEELAGQPVVFEVTVKSVQEQQKTPLTEDQKAQVRQQVYARRKAMADQEIEDQVLSIILAEAQVELPEAMVESEANICLQQFAAELGAKGMTIDQFAQQTGKTLAGMRDEMIPLARRRIQLRLVLSAVAEQENITATQEELDQCWDQMAQQYGMPKEHLQQYAGADMEQELRADIISQKAYALLRESTILDQE